MYQQENNPYTAFTMPPTGNPMSPDLARFIMSLSNLLPQNPMLAGNTYDNMQRRKQLMQEAGSEPSSAIVGATPQTQSYQAPQMQMPRTAEEWAAFRAATERLKQQMSQQPIPQKSAPKGRIKVIKKTYIDETGTPVDYYVDERGNKYDYDPNLNNF